MKQSLLIPVIISVLVFLNQSCRNTAGGNMPVSEYFNYGDSGVQVAGIKMIPVKTPVGDYKVWVKRWGNNPRIKVLLLHGGPAATHQYLECFQSFFPKEGFEFYEYDQLGCGNSDKPTDSSLWTLDRFVEEVEQVRQAIGAGKDNFYILGNSWGGILGMQYALKYQDNMKALMIANMMASCPDYGKYADEVLAKQMDPAVVKEIKELEAKGEFENPRYMELLGMHYYAKYICRLPEWPEPVNRAFADLNYEIYKMMQGPSEFGIAGRLANWDIKDRLKEIKIPVLTIGAKYDTMDPNHMNWMSSEVQKGRYLYCPNGSHLAMWDDQQVFMNGVIKFIRDVDAGRF
jgi:proline iminopeptidase